MRKNRSTLSKAASYEAMGDFWDRHDLSDYWQKTKAASIEVQIESERTFCEIDNKLAIKVQRVARRHRVSSRGLVNKWVREKLREEALAVPKKE